MGLFLFSFRYRTNSDAFVVCQEFFALIVESSKKYIVLTYYTCNIIISFIHHMDWDRVNRNVPVDWIWQHWKKVRPPCLSNWNIYICEGTSLYWGGPLIRASVKPALFSLVITNYALFAPPWNWPCDTLWYLSSVLSSSITLLQT